MVRHVSERSDSTPILKLGSISGICKKLFNILSKQINEKLPSTAKLQARKQKLLRQITKSPCLDAVGPS